VDAVFILTRHHLHTSQVIAALDAGKHVFVEKPLAVSAEDCAQLACRLSTVRDQLLMVGFNRRFSPMSQRFRDFLREGKEPIHLHYRVNAGYVPPNHWVHELAEGGRLIGEGCHFIDYCSWVIGEAPRTVTARALPNVGRYCDDNLVIVLEYPNGSLGVITYVAAGDRSTGKERVEGFCGGRTAILDDYWSLLLAHDGRRRNFHSRFQQDKGHSGECADFVSAIRQASPSPISVSEILATTKATIAAADSLRRGEPVTVPLPAVGASFRA
jgi:predicted dehydrogenase